MLKNFIRTTLRNLWRYKGFSTLNMLSLALGIAFALVIGLWVQDEWRYNRFHDQIDRLYLVWTNADWGGVQTWETSPGPLRPQVKAEIPEVKGATRVSSSAIEHLLTIGDKNVKESGLYVDNDFLKMFSFPLAEGDPNSALQSPNSIVLTRQVADQLFGHDDPIGKAVKLDNNKAFTVTGIIERVPEHSTIQFRWLLPFEEFENENPWAKTWGNVSFKTYLELHESADQEAVEEKMATFEGPQGRALAFFLQPFKDKYLFGDFEEGRQVGGRIEYVQLFSAVAIFLLIIACINFMNLSTARATYRAKEIGVRKTVGANRRSLIVQFIGEALFLSCLSFGLALFLARLALGQFNLWFEKSIQLDLSNPFFWVLSLGLITICGLLAGSYPALLMSGIKPVRILKGELLQIKDQSVLLRRALVVFQFVISGILIVATFTISQQMAYVQSNQNGVDRNNLFHVFLNTDEQTNIAVQERLSSSTSIESFTITGGNPMNNGGSSGDLRWPGKSEEEMLLVAGLTVDDQFLTTMGLELVAGRDFSKNIASDTSNYIVNESLVKELGLEDPIGTKIGFWNGDGQIIGVVKDYHLQSLHIPIRPMLLCYTSWDWLLWVRPVEGKTKEALAEMEDILAELRPGYPFEYEFADQLYAGLYRNELLTGKLANVFGIIAIIISCLGLLGLAAYSTERKRKEISIRKVLGASIQSILQLLSREFFWLIIVSLVITIPLGWFIMQTWLKQFAYRIDIPWWIFGLVGLISISITMLMVGIHSIRAAVSNPVKSLRDQ